MNINFKLSVAFALALLFGVNAFGQEWEYSIPYYMADPEMTRQYCAYELSDGRIIISAQLLYNDGSYPNFYPPHNALIALSADGEELAQMDYFRDSYWGSSYNPYVFENENGEVFALMSYSPDHDPDYFNYFLNYENPPTDAILGLYKLNDDLEIVESFEYSFPIDTAQGQDNMLPCDASGNIFMHSAILDDGYIVGAYTKSVSLTSNPTGKDSLFFFRMNFEGDLLANVGIETNYSGMQWQGAFWREQMVSTDYGYIYYSRQQNTPPAPNSVGENREYAGTVAYLDKDFNLLRTRKLVHPGGNGGGFYWFDDVSVVRSDHNTTYMATRSSRHSSAGKSNCFLYEFDDDIENTQEIVPITNEIERKSDDHDFVAECKAVEVGDDHSVYFCYSLNVGFDYGDSWIVIERFDEDFNTIQTVYYGTDSDRQCYVAESISLTNDDGVLLVLESIKLDDFNIGATSVVKFPAEAFVGIEEAHENGLKVAIAYPNPGKDVLNIRTGLQDARVEVYDVNGRLVHRQDITEDVTEIDAGDWAEGVYVWNVIANGKMVETGKWVKSF
ncbi:MAG: T9SS type A sorting domain-containing protein [Bacteroidales bacterium]|nr:T9SS type A sorting domain-containing protein [Bacteroidales bacterium]MBR3492708.1 T9SS type A sorting domain-containing protein [Bacteroidales bacterium]